MMRFKSFWLAVQFFTRWPTPQYERVEAQDMGKMLLWFPLIGALIGSVLALISGLQAWLPAQVVALLILVAWVWQTGGLHIDGAADFCDAWLGSCGDQARALTIMKDSRIGTGGGVAIGLILLSKWVLLSALLETQQNAPILLWLMAIPIIARIGSLVLIATTSEVQQAGREVTMFTHLSKRGVAIWGGLALVVMLVIQPILLLLIAVAWLLRRTIQRTLGGMNGDSAGLMTETLEISALLLIVLSLSTL
ncbi:MAG: adenosylcobinamide-GDP ribazoletransferase [Thiomicrospira sp.]|jgi:adenosylcobinamide-GDP ribazoletransferase|nr:adenosylcobinamide-GDP ribazoletransferase [Thiomicrospira sp.]